jgi:hypothetical protein
MARAKRHYIPWQIWHITHRCHKREFLLKFAKDRRRWLHWLFDRVKSILGALASGRKSIEAGEAYQLREPYSPYSAHFGVKKGDIGHENTYFWNVNL